MGINHPSPEKAALQAGMYLPFLYIHSNVIRFFELQGESESKRESSSQKSLNSRVLTYSRK
ncbi:hypothetical protein KSF_103760 [Reticulibacter mediterranei]|uniref:Uncharacterized protein n=1 Tax=Reticulibacter mediterranei TaxID=2778369 RepID=A0A8J3N931_9CHLR|nr:hypothetical protein KSF_103760 [Reticulibacter mediterranei]